MKNYDLTNIDSEDFGAFIFKVERSFSISFSREDFIEIDTFGEFSGLVIRKLNRCEDLNCSSQQSFYKIKNAFSKILNVDVTLINPSSKMELILPRKNRRSNVKQLEKQLGFELGILEPKKIVTDSIFGLGIYSIILFYYDWKITVFGLFCCIMANVISRKFGNELNVTSFSEMIKKVTKENYSKSRKDNHAFNKTEVEKMLEKWFIEEFSLESETA